MFWNPNDQVVERSHLWEKIKVSQWSFSNAFALFTALTAVDSTVRATNICFLYVFPVFQHFLWIVRRVTKVNLKQVNWHLMVLDREVLVRQGLLIHLFFWVVDIVFNFHSCYKINLTFLFWLSWNLFTYASCL